MNKVFDDMQNLDGFVDLPELEDLSIQKNGIININDIEIKFPNLTVLDLSYNKIFSVKNLEYLSDLPNIAEINLQNNPILVHKE